MGHFRALVPSIAASVLTEFGTMFVCVGGCEDPSEIRDQRL